MWATSGFGCRTQNRDQHGYISRAEEEACQRLPARMPMISLSLYTVSTSHRNVFRLSRHYSAYDH
jgi:hypothetical protein